MTVCNSIVLAFSMFSTIPCPHVAWTQKNMRYVLCAFPLVGAVIGALLLGWGRVIVVLAEKGVTLPAPLAALGFVLLPLVVSGGIHLDGFMDTCDALGSRADREKKLAIMKDSHCGSFAVMGCVLLVLSQYACALSVTDRLPALVLAATDRGKPWVTFGALFVFSRLLSACAVAAFPLAKESGLARTFSDASAKRVTVVWSAVWYAALAAALVYWCGGYGVTVSLVPLFVWAWYFVRTHRAFGGITGDTAGWFVQLAEGITGIMLSLHFLLY